MHASLVHSDVFKLLRGFSFLPLWLAAAERQRLAKEVASVLKLSVEIDTSKRLVHLPPLYFAKNKYKILWS